MDTLTPKDHGEALALYRAQIVGAVASRELDRGDLREALLELSKQRFRPPRSHGTRTYSLATLERWYYAYKSGGLDALRPEPRSEAARGPPAQAGGFGLRLEVAVPAEAGRGSRLKPAEGEGVARPSGAGSPSTRKSPSCCSWSWFSMYALITSSVTFPLLQQKYPRAQMCRPQNVRRRCENSIINVCDDRPFNR
jgi:hypothetical protein